ncbi:MAG: type I restriction-modification enzyme R subunit C-terminal domain-containing protein [Gemmatimonadales bacterium]|nr:type I restriction-modification enzyme R subunit C-terminal domain-containing protein [Gemmatimonadales bacterium]
MISDSLTPEQRARVNIDAMLAAAGWVVQSRDEINLHASRGVAVREFPLSTGPVDYLLMVDQQAVGVLEAKPEGHTLSGVEGQAERYSAGLPTSLTAPIRPLPFLYQSTGVETAFTNGLDPDPRARRVFAVHRPETLAEWLAADTLDAWVRRLAEEGTGLYTSADDTKPSTLRSRIRAMPNLEAPRLYPNQIEAVTKLERSFREGRPRALVQMATGSGKTMFAITSIYRLIKFGGARRILFLVDRKNLGEQAELEFEGYRTPDDNRKLTELYNVQRLTTNTIGASSKVVITTVQRLYSMLSGQPELDPEAEEDGTFGKADALITDPVPIAYNAAIPPDYFDVIVIDECHRSIYSLWRQVLEYFDAFLVGLTATPAKHTFGFFEKNLVMEYSHERAVADGVNVDFEVYRIRTKISEHGSTVEAGPGVVLGYRNRQSRAVRWEAPDDDYSYGAEALDRSVVAPDQIRTIVRTFRDKLFSEIFPGRTEVPKTLVFAKDDAHAELIVDIIRTEFGRGNSFAKKITYRSTGATPKELITEFRNSFEPRIAVTVDMVATGTDIRPIEIVMFMRTVKSRVLFDQMKGRGVRIIDPAELQAVTPDATVKTHFVIVDCVGVVESELLDCQPLERKKSVSLASLLEHVAMGGSDPEYLSTLASRLSRLDKEASPEQHERITAASGGPSLADLARSLVEALDGDRQDALARQTARLAEGEEPTPEQLSAAARVLSIAGAKPLASNPALRQAIIDLRAELEQVIDEVSQDEVLFAGATDEAKARAAALTTSFEEYLRTHADEIDALQYFYARPHGARLRLEEIRALANDIKAPPRSWTPEQLWRAYEVLAADRVRGASGQRLLTDIVSLVRFALHQDNELAPHSERVRERFAGWLARHEQSGRQFSAEQLRWLEMMRDHVAGSLTIDLEDFDLVPFAEAGGLGAAGRVFGPELRRVVDELNEALAA